MKHPRGIRRRKSSRPPAIDHQILHLRQQWMRRWVTITGMLWLTVGLSSLWSLRRTFAQLADYFTWAALRYGLAFNRLAAAGLGLCCGLTIILLCRELRYQIWGMPRSERYQFLKALRRSRPRS